MTLVTGLLPDDFDQVAGRVSALIQARSLTDSPIKIIIVEGEDGAGKTFFAAKLAQFVGAKHVELDGHLRQRAYEREPFLDLVNMAAFSAAIQAASPVVADGVLISDVLDKAEIANNLRIYVRRISSTGLWNYGLNLVRGRLVEVPWAAPSMLEEEIFEYHLRRLPHACANLCFNRVG